jgi:hypothetical protein
MKPLRDLIESFTWSPSLPVPWLAGIATAAALLFVVTAWRERDAAKRPVLLPVLWLLRAAAIAAISLALAGPSRQLTKRETTRQGVTIIVDSSGSMSLSDPDALVPEWSGMLPDDPSRGILTAARHHLRKLELLPPAQWHSPVAAQSIRDAAKALSSVPSSWQSPSLKQAVPRLEAAADTLESGKSLLIQDFLRELAEMRGEAEKILTSLRIAPPNINQLSTDGPARTRLARVADWLDAAEKTWLRECRAEFDVSISSMGTVAVPASESVRKSWRERKPAEGPQTTDLAAALDEAARDAGLGRARAVVLITDGCHNAAAPAEEAAARLRGLPLICVPAGAVASRSRQDLAMLYAIAPATAYLHDTIRIEGVLSGAGCEGVETEVMLREGDRVIDRRKVHIKDGAADPKIEFEWKPERVGHHNLRIEATPLKQEVTNANNSQETGIEVMEDTLRVMIADREPRWETRYLLNLLKRDKRMEFQTLLFAPAHSSGEGTAAKPPAFPYKLDDWARNRIVLLGDVLPSQLTVEHQQMLVDYVTKRGGTLILMAGSDAMPAAYAGQPLGSLIPVTEQPLLLNASYKLTLTPEGRELDSMKLGAAAERAEEVWANATTKVPLVEMSPWSVAKPQARVLLNAVPLTGAADPPRAFLTWQDAGRGRVIYLSSPETWHLRYLEGDRWHYRFWGQLLHWAVARDLAGGSRSVHLALDRQRAPQDAPVYVRLRLEDLTGKAVSGANSRAVVREANGTETSAVLTEDSQAPGNYTGMLTGLPLGPCRVAVEGPEIDRLLIEEGRQGKIDAPLFIDPPENREARDVLCDMGQISRIAAAGGGWVLPPGAVPDALKKLGLRASVTEETSLTPLWNEWPWLWLILGLLTAEWILRKPAGLL